MTQIELDEIDAKTRIQERTAYKMAIKALEEKRRYYRQYIEMARYGLDGWDMNLRARIKTYFRYTRAIEYFENKLSALTK